MNHLIEKLSIYKRKIYFIISYRKHYSLYLYKCNLFDLIGYLSELMLMTNIKQDAL
jgi:hypothetical protein